MAQRRWRLTAADPFAQQLAADARLSATDFTDDQAWEVALGMGDAPAFALRTGLGGRVGLLSLVPMWIIQRRPIYLTAGYTHPPVITRFAPAYMQLEAKLTPTLTLRADVWVISSHQLGAVFTLKNSASAPAELALQLVGFAVTNNRELKVKPLAGVATDGAGSGALLTFGQLGRSFPLALLENSSVDSDGQHITASLTIKARASASLRLVFAAEKSLSASLAAARRALSAGWTSALRRIARADDAIPNVQTGDEALDAVIAFSYQQVMQAFLKSTTFLPHPSPVGARQPGEGYSVRGTGADMPRSWSGQSAQLAYLTALAAAPIDKTLAQGVIRNFIAVQRDDGWIDAKPGLGGSTMNALCMPILARLAWQIGQITRDDAFIAEVFPPLLRFFTRWFARDHDADGDGFPEWTSEAQMGYPFFPTFAQGLPFGQNANVRAVETPDLAAYLLSEALSLRAMAAHLQRDDAANALEQQVERLRGLLDAVWSDPDGRYRYRDRDTHLTHAGRALLTDGRGDQDHALALDLTPPARVIITVRGGAQRPPRFTLVIEGRDHNGDPVHEQLQTSDFVWATGRGVYTTQAAFATLDRIRAEGLIAAYRIDARALDTSDFDLNGVLPLWSGGLSPVHARRLIDHITSAAHFWRANGVIMASAASPYHDPHNAVGSMSVWLFYATLIGEALLDAGAPHNAAALVKKLLTVQAHTLRDQKAFYETYHADAPHGMGERASVIGAAPLHLLHRVFGARVISKTQVAIERPCAWDAPITITQHGVSIQRTPAGTTIMFASGQVVSLPADAPAQIITAETQS